MHDCTYWRPYSIEMKRVAVDKNRRRQSPSEAENRRREAENRCRQSPSEAENRRRQSPSRGRESASTIAVGGRESPSTIAVERKRIGVDNRRRQAAIAVERRQSPSRGGNRRWLSPYCIRFSALLGHRTVYSKVTYIHVITPYMQYTVPFLFLDVNRQITCSVPPVRTRVHYQ